MSSVTFKALVVEEPETNKFKRSIKTRKIEDLPEGEVLIKVMYSSLNYKDALSARGHKGITRTYPHTPGIDASGIVEESKSVDFSPGDEVLVTGYDMGMNTDGGFGEYIRVPASWVVKMPENLSLQESMVYGTAGFTAGICIYELNKHGITPGRGKIMVTGATGGVGCTAVGMLAKIGYDVIASTGKTERRDFLMKLGAKEVIGRNDVFDITGRPLLSGRWIGAIDTVGGNTLSTVIRSTKHRGIVCCLGNVESDRFESSVYPFILRGITMVGIDSAERPMDIRKEIWDKISTDWKIANTNVFTRIVSLKELDGEIEKILTGGQVGRIVLKHNHK